METSNMNEYRIGKLKATKRFCKHRDNENDFLYEINLESMNVYLMPNMSEIVFLKECNSNSGDYDIEFDAGSGNKFFEIVAFEKVKSFIKLTKELAKASLL